jgi:hypothetical protein
MSETASDLAKTVQVLESSSLELSGLFLGMIPILGLAHAKRGENKI